ncbi:methyltransferase domain-containing protein [Methylobacterium sp. WL30]|uniref:SAM-dependent methyltransferase n=1 Tax=unclassified Methylobacterium TaxID=2615210 RepID=UPI0011CB1BB6|nr:MULTISPECIES: SAM-dependent methyltransferase [unclassified Methylobacterium]TXM88267.1 methyltransferase domain-containing protein [Methylobacterium sp. WL116]TXN22956.1 methyltransferase domain-containing protein [Methylobacterium sp. WL93]TXN51122.1 methyltransferase domain-containing protein [Methylobacterium sp. WL119]TXN69867.1 methyltransferase domain-containing protein [Methylobacterium sp. WL30]
MSRRADSLTPDYFAGLYGADPDPDPWGFTTSAYEAAKYAATLEALPRERYASGLEIGCSIGVLTHRLAPRCAALLGIDVVETALAAARARNAAMPWVRFEACAIPDTWPAGRFDLIVLSEVAYFFSRADVARIAARIGSSILPGGHIVLVHWLGETDYPLSGDAAAEALIADARFARPVHRIRAAEYRLDVLHVDGVAAEVSA